MIDDFGDPHPTTHRYFLTLTAAVAGIIGSGTDIANLDSQPHWPDLFRCNIIVTYPTTPSVALIFRTSPSPPTLLHPNTPHPYYLHIQVLP